MDAIYLRRLSKLVYVDPMKELAKVEPLAMQIRRNEEVNLDSHKRRRHLEDHQKCALGALLQVCLRNLGFVELALEEADDFDGVIRISPADKTQQLAFVPLQIKELPSGEKNPKVSIQDLIDKAAQQYPQSAELIVAIFIERAISFDFAKLDFSKLKIQQFYLVGTNLAGQPSLDGAMVEDLKVGLAYRARMTDSGPTVIQYRFRNPNPYSNRAFLP